MEFELAMHRQRIFPVLDKRGSVTSLNKITMEISKRGIPSVLSATPGGFPKPHHNTVFIYCYGFGKLTLGGEHTWTCR